MKAKTIKEEERNYPALGAQVKVTTTGNVVEIMEMEKVNRLGSSIINFGDGAYCRASDYDPDTGEVTGEGVKFFQRTENRGQNKNGLAKSMKDCRDLINCNVQDVSKVRWMTLTYAENMTDRERLYIDRKAFWKRVIRWHDKQGIVVPEYISIAEPQGRGAWHLHELWIYPCRAPFLPNETIRELWRNGFVTVKKLDDVDNVGAYVTSYLCDIPIDEAEKQGVNPSGYVVKEAEITEDDGTKVTKKFLKGARAHMYPANMHFYRPSRGVKHPTVEWMSAEKARKKVKAATLTFSKTIRLTDDVKDYSNDIHYEYYNTAKPKERQP